MKPRIVCLTCRIEYTSTSDPRLTWRDPDSQAEAPKQPSATSGNRLYTEQKRDYELYCEQKHLLPDEPHVRPLLVFSTYGESRAGKGALVRTMSNLLGSGELAEQGISAHLNPIQQADFDAKYPIDPNVEPPATVAGIPKVPYHFTMVDSAQRSSETNLSIIDSAGEDGDTVRGVQKVTPFVNQVDVITFFVPPGALGRLPDEIRGGAYGRDQHTLKTSDRIIQSVLKAAERQGSTLRSRVIYIVLTKADRYVGLPAFPQDLLRGRPYRLPGEHDYRSIFAEEQEPLREFVRISGGKQLLNSAAAKGDNVFVTAVSGTGSDTVGTPASVNSAPNRALDPLVAALMRTGHGDFGAL